MEVSPQGAQVPAPVFPVSAGPELIQSQRLDRELQSIRTPACSSETSASCDVEVTSQFSSRHNKLFIFIFSFFGNSATTVGAAGRL